MRDNHRVLHLTVLPGADPSYRQKTWGTITVSSTWLFYLGPTRATGRKKHEGQLPCPPFDCPTWGRHELQAKKNEGQSPCPPLDCSTWDRHELQAKIVRDNHCVLHLTVLPGADTSYRQITWGTITVSSTFGLFYLGPTRATGKNREGQSLCTPLSDCSTWGRHELQANNKRDNHRVLHFRTVQPGADTSYRQITWGTITVSSTWLFYQGPTRATGGKTWGTITVSSTCLFYQGPTRATGKTTRGTITVSSTWLSYLGPTRATGRKTWGTITVSSTWLFYFNWPQVVSLFRHRLDSNTRVNIIMCTFLLS